jgi:signal transduction histidine kinase
MKRLDLRNTIWLWLITVMLLSILVGGYMFIVHVRRQAYLSRAQTTFVSNVTHELRTPLTSIRMFAELLERQLGDAPAGGAPRTRGNPAQHLRIIRQESERLSRLIDRVLDFSRMERQLRQYHFEPHDIGEVVADAVEAFRPQADARGFTLELTVEGPFPSQPMDADAISQVLINLLTNAVQYSRDRKEIQVRVARRPVEVVIEVADQGIGIEPREQRRVFDKFYSTWRRMDDRTQGGLGLGLSLSREIVRAHGGDMTVRSEVGRGSTFTATIPLHPVEPATDEAAHPAGEPAIAARMGGQRV